LKICYDHLTWSASLHMVLALRLGEVSAHAFADTLQVGALRFL